MVVASDRARYVLRQFAWGAAVMWLVLTVAWVILNTVPDVRLVGFSEVDAGFAAAYDDPPGPLGLYVDWMVSFVTLDWGMSAYFGEPVVDLYRTRLPVTLAYTVPGVLAGVVVGTGVTTYAAVRPSSPLNRVVSALSYVGLSVPTFVVAQGLFFVLPTWLGWVRVYDPDLGLTHGQNVRRLALPAAIVAFSFLAVQVRHARSETTEYLGQPFVRVVEAKGAGRLRTAVHVFLNSWPSLTSLVLGESLGLLLLVVIVIEEIFKIQGIAVVVYYGFASGDPMVSFTAVFGVVLLGVAGTLARDVLRVAYDPRVEA